MAAVSILVGCTGNVKPKADSSSDADTLYAESFALDDADDYIDYQSDEIQFDDYEEQDSICVDLIRPNRAICNRTQIQKGRGVFQRIGNGFGER